MVTYFNIRIFRLLDLNALERLLKLLFKVLICTEASNKKNSFSFQIRLSQGIDLCLNQLCDSRTDFTKDVFEISPNICQNNL